MPDIASGAKINRDIFSNIKAAVSKEHVRIVGKNYKLGQRIDDKDEPKIDKGDKGYEGDEGIIELAIEKKLIPKENKRGFFLKKWLGVGGKKRTLRKKANKRKTKKAIGNKKKG